jgi:hypothetical protein
MKYSGLLGRAITPPSPYYLKSVRMDTEFDWCAWAEVSGAYGEEITVQIEPGEYNVLADLVGKEVVLTMTADNKHVTINPKNKEEKDMKDGDAALNKIRETYKRLSLDLQDEPTLGDVLAEIDREESEYIQVRFSNLGDLYTYHCPGAEVGD